MDLKLDVDWDLDTDEPAKHDLVKRVLAEELPTFGATIAERLRNEGLNVRTVSFEEEFSVGDRVRMAPPFNSPDDPGGTVVGFTEPQADGRRYLRVRWDTGDEAEFAEGALQRSQHA